MSDFDYERECRNLFEMLAATCGCLYDAEDIAQDTFLSEFKCRRQHRVIQSPQGWRRTVAWRKENKLARDAVVRGRHLRRLFQSRFGAVENDSGRKAVRNEVVMAVRRAVAKLPMEFQQVVKRQLTGQSFDEIAERLGMAPSTVKYRFQQALPILRRKLRQFGRCGDR